jgi:uncharacterized protein involved in type VI secretion and phage assembly
VTGSVAQPRRFFGKYRGIVVDNADPEKSGRLKVKVPAVLADAMTTWALPCMPVAVSGAGVYLVPPRDAQVWVEFEGGDPGMPIWTGCFWRAREAPETGKAAPETKVIKFGGTLLTMADTEKGAMTLSVGGAQGPSIKLTDKQLELVCGKSKIIIADGTVKIEIVADTPSIVVSQTALTLKSGTATVQLDQSGKVALNGPALEVTTP